MPRSRKRQHDPGDNLRRLRTRGRQPIFAARPYLPRTVLLLGSGASRAFGLSVQSDLLSSLQRAAKGEGQKETVQWLRKFHRYGTDIEEILTTIEIANSTRDHATMLHPDVPWDDWNLIIGLLGRSLKFTKRKLRLGLPTYRRLFSHLQSHRLSIISLNYDIYTEGALLETGMTPDYCVPFDIARPFPLPRGSTPIHVPFLKPHGSLNWGYCSTCSTLHCSGLVEHPLIESELLLSSRYGNHVYNDWRWQLSSFENDPIPQCLSDPHGNGHSFTIPIQVPSKLKSVRIIPTEPISRLCHAALIAADIVVIIGCSLREADTDMRYLLHASLAKRDSTPAVFAFVSPETRTHLIDFFGMRALSVKGTRVAGGRFLNLPNLRYFSEWLAGAVSQTRRDSG